MPQPIRRNERIVVQHFPKCLLERPRLAALIGTIAAEWGHIDSCLVEIYERAVTDKWARDQVAVAVFETLSSVTLKLEIIRKVLRLRVVESLVTDFEENVRPLIRKGAGERATVLHGDWGISDSYPDDLILKTVGGRLMRYTENDFLNILDRLNPIRNAANDMVIKIHHGSKKESSN